MLKNSKKKSLFNKTHDRIRSNENINTNIMNTIFNQGAKINKLTDPKILHKIIEEYKQEIINIKQFLKFNEENNNINLLSNIKEDDEGNDEHIDINKNIEQKNEGKKKKIKIKVLERGSDIKKIQKK